MHTGQVDREQTAVHQVTGSTVPLVIGNDHRPHHLYNEDDRLKPLMGQPSFPTLSYELSHKTKKDKKGVAFRPKASNQKMGTYCLSLVDSTMADQGDDTQVVDPTSYMAAIKGLLKKGIWPNKTSGPALQEKLNSYKGDVRFYVPANKKCKIL